MGYMTAANQSQFIPELWAAVALGIFHDKAVMARLVHRDFEEVVSKMGNTVNVGERGTLVAQDKVAGSPVTLQSPTGSLHSIVLNKHKEVSFTVEDVAGAQGNPKNMFGYMFDGMKAISKAVDIDLLSLYASLSTTIANAGDITEATVRSAKRLLDDREVDDDGRFLVVDTSQAEALSLISRFTDADKIGVAGYIEKGAVGRIHGFDVMSDPRVRTSGTSPVYAYGLAFNRNAFALVTRPLELPASDLGVRALYAEQDGIVLRILYGYNLSYLGTQCTIDILYGCGVLRDTCGIVVRTHVTAVPTV